MIIHLEVNTDDPIALQHLFTVAQALAPTPLASPSFRAHSVTASSPGPVDFETPEQSQYRGSEAEKMDQAISTAMKGNPDFQKKFVSTEGHFHG